MAYARNYYGWYGTSISHPSISRTDSLAHYGVRGQKWGVRRYQNEDGTLTEEGMRRYGIVGEDGKLKPSSELSADYRNYKKNNSLFLADIQKEKKENKPISQRRQQLINDYKSKGLTQEQAEVEALKRERTEKIVKIAGAVALTAALAYGAYKGQQWLKMNGNTSIKKGEEIQRIMKTAQEPGERAAYVAVNPKDATKYRGMYGSQIKSQRDVAKLFGVKGGPEGVYRFTGNATDKIKIAGSREGKKTFERLMKSDPEFAKDTQAVLDEWNKNPMLRGVLNNGRNQYEKFNIALPEHDMPEAARIQSKFYNALKNKGFGGVIDVNDLRYSGYQSKKPIVLFNLNDNITNKKIAQLSDIEVDQALNKAKAIINKDSVRDVYLSEAFKTVRNYAGYGAIGSALGLAVTKSNDRKNLSRGTQYKTIVSQYKKEHPGTQLSDAQILENYLGYTPWKRS